MHLSGISGEERFFFIYVYNYIKNRQLMRQLIKQTINEK